MGSEACDRGQRADNGIADFDQHLAVAGQEHIDARTEFDEPAHVILPYMLSDFHIGDDTAGNQAGNLAEEHMTAVLHFHDGRRTFVFGRGLGVPCDEETAGMVFEIFDDTADGHPVHVDVRNRHEDRDLHHLLIEIFAFVYGFRHDDTAVAGREDQIGIMNLHTPGFAEKGHDEEPEQQHQDDHDPYERIVVVVAQQVIDARAEQQADQARDADDFVALFIDFHLNRD